MTVSTEAARAVQLFHALSDETRLGIIQQLENGERCVCELQDTLDAAQSRLSFHLKVLKDAGFVTDRRAGRWSYYELDRDAFDDAEAALKLLRPDTRRKRGAAATNAACCG